MLNAFITVFIIITCDNWTDIMYPMMAVSGLNRSYSDAECYEAQHCVSMLNAVGVIDTTCSCTRHFLCANISCAWLVLWFPLLTKQNQD